MSNHKYTKDWLNLPIPKVFPDTYLAIAEERGVQANLVLKQAGLPQHRLNPQSGFISFAEYERLVDAAVALAGDNGIGLQVGWRLPPTAYGNFGYALLCCAHLLQAVEVCQRFWHLIAKGIDFSFDVHADTCVIDLGFLQEPPPQMRKLSMESTLVSIYRGFQLLLGDHRMDGEIWFDFNKPEYWDQISLPLCNVKHAMPANQFRFAKTRLDAPLEMSNPTGFQFAWEQCEREDAMADNKSSQILARVKQQMVFSIDGYPNLEQLGHSLNMTSRTLRRRLDEEGSKYSTLLEQARRRDAIRLLDNPDLDIQKVAELLGYADPANFTRAFRQWTGQAPSQYRSMRKS